MKKFKAPLATPKCGVLYPKNCFVEVWKQFFPFALTATSAAWTILLKMFFVYKYWVQIALAESTQTTLSSLTALFSPPYSVFVDISLIPLLFLHSNSTPDDHIVEAEKEFKVMIKFLSSSRSWLELADGCSEVKIVSWVEESSYNKYCLASLNLTSKEIVDQTFTFNIFCLLSAFQKFVPKK